MENNQMNTVEATIAKFSDTAEAEHLPFGSEQGWTSSEYYMASYLREHADNGAGLNSEEVALFATGRLEWLLRESRASLSGLFSKQDVIVLLNCFQGDLFAPDQLSKIPTNVCDDLGIELDEYESSSIGPLINTLLELTSIQQVALADALEQLWHRGMTGDMEEFLASLEIVLAK